MKQTTTEFYVDLRELVYSQGQRIYVITEEIDTRLREAAVSRKEDSVAGQVARAYLEHIKKMPGAKVKLWLNLEGWLRPPNTHAFKSQED